MRIFGERTKPKCPLKKIETEWRTYKLNPHVAWSQESNAPNSAGMQVLSAQDNSLDIDDQWASKIQAHTRLGEHVTRGKSEKCSVIFAYPESCPSRVFHSLPYFSPKITLLAVYFGYVTRYSQQNCLSQMITVQWSIINNFINSFTVKKKTTKVTICEK